MATLTAYGASPRCGMGTNGDGITKSGTRVVEGWTLACDPEVLPLGSLVLIDGLEGWGRDGEMMCVDIGSKVKGIHIDVYLDDEDDPTCERHRDFGRQRRRIEVLHVPKP